MEITPEHRAAASRIVNQMPSQSFPPAYTSYLSAIERLDDDKASGGPTALWTDRAGDRGEAYPFDGGITLRLHDSITTPPARATQILDADEAEARGWELIALAHLARQGSSPLDASGSTEGRG